MKRKWMTTAAVTLALLAVNAAFAGTSADPLPSYSVPGIDALISWLFGR